MVRQDGATPLDVAVARNHFRVAEWLQRWLEENKVSESVGGTVLVLLTMARRACCRSLLPVLPGLLFSVHSVLLDAAMVLVPVPVLVLPVLMILAQILLVMMLV
jgi:hypothetical protein